jgi:phosphoglucosamine mutase
VDGDQIMYICGKYMKEQGRLKHNTVVSTVMSNLGFYKGLESNGIQSVQTAVGDRYVVEEMKKNGYNLGGEQSGHIIFLDYITTGDGLLTGLQLVNIMKVTKKPLSELAKEMKKFPQKLVNIRVTDKHHVTDNEKVKEVISQVEEEMNGNGRILVRPSGTEPLVRVMAEAPTGELCSSYVERISAVVESEMGLKE